MSILDNNLLFSNGQKLTSTANSTVLDFKEPGDAVGQELTIRVIVAEEFAGLTSLQIKLQTGETSSDFKDVLMTPAIPAANLKRGAEIFKIRAPGGMKRYARINYVVSGTATAGAVTAYMSKEL